MKKKSLAGTFILFNFFFIGSGYYYDEEENASRKLKKKLLQNSCDRMVSWKGGDLLNFSFRYGGEEQLWKFRHDFQEERGGFVMV